MSPELALIRYPQLRVDLPLEQVRRRLGFRRRHTVLSARDQQRLQQLVLQLLAVAAPCGVALVCRLRRLNDAQLELLPSGQVITSSALSQLVGDAEALALFAATIGNAAVQLRDQTLAAADGEAALIIDAAASELADAAIATVQELTRHRLRAQGYVLDKRRFSPGYGDLDLATQAVLFEMLDLAKLGLHLTERFLLVPEKSVTALAAVRAR